MSKIALGIFALAIVVGCGPKEPPPGPVAGTVNMDGLTPEQKIEKIKNDPSIPDQYKQTFIASQQAQAGKR